MLPCRPRANLVSSDHCNCPAFTVAWDIFFGDVGEDLQGRFADRIEIGAICAHIVLLRAAVLNVEEIARHGTSQKLTS